jgi:transposase
MVYVRSLTSYEGMSAREIAKVIRRFSSEGMKLLKERPHPGRTPKFSEEDRVEIVEWTKTWKELNDPAAQSETKQEDLLEMALVPIPKNDLVLFLEI